MQGKWMCVWMIIIMIHCCCSKPHGIPHKTTSVVMLIPVPLLHHKQLLLLVLLIISLLLMSLATMGLTYLPKTMKLETNTLALYGTRCDKTIGLFLRQGSTKTKVRNRPFDPEKNLCTITKEGRRHDHNPLF
jgi:hypothetical protein